MKLGQYRGRVVEAKREGYKETKMLLASVCLWVPAALLAAAFPQQQQQQQHLQQQQQQQDYDETVVVFPDQVDKKNFIKET